MAGPDILIFLETWLPTRMSGLVSFGVKLYDPFLVAIKKIIGSYVIWGRMNRINDNLFETTLYNVWMREYKCWLDVGDRICGEIRWMLDEFCQNDKREYCGTTNRWWC